MVEQTHSEDPLLSGWLTANEAAECLKVESRTVLLWGTPGQSERIHLVRYQTPSNGMTL